MKPPPYTVVLVLRSGGDFRPKHAATLIRNISTHSSAKVVCLTDWVRPVERYCEVIPLRYDWPGWWSKFEAFRIPGPALYLDLDTVVVADPSGLVPWDSECLWGLERFRFYGRLASGVMAWGGDLSEITDFFHRRGPVGPNCLGGDQVAIEETCQQLRIPINFFPRGDVVSYKRTVRKTGIPEGTSIVAFHGKPRPWEIGEPWMERAGYLP